MGNRTILLVEDNPDDEALTLRALNKHKLADEIVVARDGAEAIAWLFPDDGAAHPSPQVILLDLKLSKLDGLEVLRQIRAHERTRRIPVVVLTSSVEEQDMVASYDLGANSYVRKPVDFEQFLEATRQLGTYWLMMNEVPRG